MTVLRAPDPTLTAYGRHVMLRSKLGDVPYEAHRIVQSLDDDGLLEVSGCGSWSTTLVLPADRAAYIAVPCRECFPDAPEPGHVRSQYTGVASELIAPCEFSVVYLDWQVAS